MILIVSGAKMTKWECELQEVTEKIQAVNPMFSEELLNLICEYARVSEIVKIEKLAAKLGCRVDCDDIEIVKEEWPDDE